MQILSDSLNFCSKKYDASILGYVLMPNHIHLIVYFPTGIYRIDFIRDFKSYTSKKVLQEIEKYQPKQLGNLCYQRYKQNYKIWQDRFDELYLVSRKLLEVKLTYIHNNPVQEHWDLVKQPSDYLYSSVMFYEKGIQNRVIVKHYMDFV